MFVGRSQHCTVRRTPLWIPIANVAPSVYKLTHGTEDDALLGSRRELGVRARGTSIDRWMNARRVNICLRVCIERGFSGWLEDADGRTDGQMQRCE